MILIADSGSTKTDWRQISRDGEVTQARSKGINPYYQSSDDIIQILKNELIGALEEKVEEIHFYGAGCSNEAKKAVVREALQSVFPEAKMEVQHDMLAAARSLCGHSAGIACILGTGANACVYDGKEISQYRLNLGYLLGDEGSGGYLGKELAKRYLSEKLPKDLAEAFEKRYRMSREEFLQKIYAEKMPNRYLASFSQFIFHHLQHPYLYKMVYDAFGLFFETFVGVFPESKDLPIHFTGSIAFYYSNLLRQVANDRGLAVRNVLESPIAGLTLYHQPELS